MGLLDRLFGFGKKLQDTKKTNHVPIQALPQNENAVRILECGKTIKSLLNSDRYIARSEYSKHMSEFSSVV
ncbi:MAG: hypothetical protein J6Y89_01790, partial [Lachnospiraceae bacterium]|nr:hypothetical protein [Lachnospiraceae bacterium]